MLNIQDMSFASSSPYPEIAPACQNNVYASWMQDNMGGANSEMTAVSSYIYNNLITHSYEEISYIFHKISIVEMHHLNIFGQLTLQLGGNPRLWTQRGRSRLYWTPGYNKYPTALPAIMENVLHNELAAIEKYERQTAAIQDENIIDNLKRIVEDEQIHVEIFREIIKEYCMKQQ